jgi:hypothetical protein
MSQQNAARAAQFHTLHNDGSILVLPMPGMRQARVSRKIAAQRPLPHRARPFHGRTVIPTAESLPTAILIAVTAEIVRAVDVPVSVDSEAGFSSDPEAVADFVMALARAGAVGINLEDGTSPPDLLAAKIAAIKSACQNSLTLAKKPSLNILIPGLVPFFAFGQAALLEFAQHFLLLAVGELDRRSPPCRLDIEVARHAAAAQHRHAFAAHAELPPDWVPSGMTILAATAVAGGHFDLPPSAAVTNDTGARQ